MIMCIYSTVYKKLVIVMLELYVIVQLLHEVQPQLMKNDMVDDMVYYVHVLVRIQQLDLVV